MCMRVTCHNHTTAREQSYVLLKSMLHYESVTTCTCDAIMQLLEELSEEEPGDQESDFEENESDNRSYVTVRTMHSLLVSNA